jgi:hypothetical protein
MAPAMIPVTRKLRMSDHTFTSAPGIGSSISGSNLEERRVMRGGEGRFKLCAFLRPSTPFP